MTEPAAAPRIRGRHREVAPGAITPNPWNPNRQSDEVYRKQKASLAVHGFAAPIVVRTLAPGQYEVIDGEHRHRAAVELSMALVPVFDLGTVEDSEAKRLTEVFIHLHGQPELAREAALIKSLCEEHALGYDEILATLPMSAVQLDSLRQAADFSWDQYVAAPPAPKSADAPKGETSGPEPTTTAPPAPATPMAFILVTGFEAEDRLRALAVLERVAPGNPAAALLALCDEYAAAHPDAE